MSIEIIHLRKLLYLMYLPDAKQVAALRAERRFDLAKEEGKTSGGGDFYGPFWADAKEHVFGHRDLRDSVNERIARNRARARLYPLLRDGFLHWWNEQRRWTNEPFAPSRSPAKTHKISDLLSIKIDGFLTVQDAEGETRYIYPYFYETPILKNESARLALWIFKQAFVGLPYNNFRILDVSKGRVYSPDRCYLEGDERDILLRRYDKLWDIWEGIGEW